MNDANLEERLKAMEDQIRSLERMCYENMHNHDDLCDKVHRHDKVIGNEDITIHELKESMIRHNVKETEDHIKFMDTIDFISILLQKAYDNKYLVINSVFIGFFTKIEVVGEWLDTMEYNFIGSERTMLLTSLDLRTVEIHSFDDCDTAKLFAEIKD